MVKKILNNLEKNMSLYNIFNWVHPSTFIILPLLDIHADNIWRFRDCFVDEK